MQIDGFVEQTKRISPTCLITFERTRYSVPSSFANRPVSLHIYHDHLEVIAEGNIIAVHTRLFNRKHEQVTTVYDWRHYLSVLQRKPGAIRNGAPFAELPQAFQSLQTILLKRVGGDREIVDILALVLLHDEQDVLTAVELATAARSDLGCARLGSQTSFRRFPEHRSTPATLSILLLKIGSVAVSVTTEVVCSV